MGKDLKDFKLKAIIEFDLPEEREEHDNALNGSKYKDKIDMMYDVVFRPHLKHQKPIIKDQLTLEHEEVMRALLTKLVDHFAD
jgi:hypothetical protein